MKRVLLLLIAGLLSMMPGNAAAAGPGDRVLRATLDLAAPVEQVWTMWTTVDGVKSFFAQGANIEPRVDGAYEIFFNVNAPAGERGADGMRILVFQPNRRLAFTWNAPPSLPEMRGQRTVVYVDLEPAGPGRTRLTFTHAGWGQGADWDAAYDYFDKAWNTFVLPLLKHRVAHGPIDWNKAPKLEPLQQTLKVALAPAR